MDAVTGLYLGVGERCRYYATVGEGNIMFDDLKILASTCVPSKGPVADLDGDCFVGWSDLDILATDWLVQDQDFNWIDTQQEPADPILWYQFNETNGTTVADSAPAAADPNDPYNGQVINQNPTLTWDTAGGRNGDGCIYLPPGSQDTYVEGTTSGNPIHWLGDSSTSSITFSIWSNADMTAYDEFSGWSGIFGTWNVGTTTETLEIHCPSPWGAANVYGPTCNFINRNTNGPTASTGLLPFGDFGGRWNNWIFVHDRTVTPAEMRVYLNGELVADANTKDGAGCALPLISSVGSLRLGTRGGNWGMWVGELDDFKIWDYALTADEVHYVATDGTGLKHIEIISPANIKLSQGPPPGSGTDIVNFGDLAVMCDEWMTEKLWP